MSKLSYILIALYFLLACCGRHGDTETQQPLDALAEQYNTYVQLAPTGWGPWDSECDSLLFASLQNVAEGKQFRVEDARDSDGMWHRRPSWADCESGPNDSSISRDMLMGLLVYSLNTKHLDIVEELWDYGVSHNWKMGVENKPEETRVFFTPGDTQLLARIIQYLGGKTHDAVYLPQIYGSEPGFPSHLTMLHIYMNGKMDGSINANQLNALRAIEKHSPENPLLQGLLHKYTDGDQAHSLDILNLWPRDRLPTDADWQSDWRTQRADGDPSFQPGTDSNPHTGGDFLFVAGILLGYI